MSNLETMTKKLKDEINDAGNHSRTMKCAKCGKETRVYGSVQEQLQGLTEYTCGSCRLKNK